MPVVVESAPRIEALQGCSVTSVSHDRRDVVLVDVPCVARPVRLVWRKRTGRSTEPACSKGVLDRAS